MRRTSQLVSMVASLAITPSLGCMGETAQIDDVYDAENAILGTAECAPGQVAKAYDICRYEAGTQWTPKCFGSGTYVLQGSPIDNDISGLKIASGYRAKLYDGTTDQTPFAVLTDNRDFCSTANNDKASKIVIEPVSGDTQIAGCNLGQVARVFDVCGYQAGAQWAPTCYGPGTYLLEGSPLNNDLSGLMIAPGYQAKIYDGANDPSPLTTLSGDRDLCSTSYNDKASKLVIEPASSESGCATGQVLCGDVCVPVQSDSNNCGACGIRCSAGQSCQAGFCKNSTAPQFRGRIAISSDGNAHDADDWGATALSLAIIARAGLTPQFVHYDYSSHIWDDDGQGPAQMTESALHGAQLFGFDTSRFFDDRRDLTGAVASIAGAVNQSSADNPLYFIIGGPMEVAWRGLQAASASKRGFVTCISHSAWNDTHTHNGSHTWTNVIALGCKANHISDQNAGFSTGDMGKWDWLKTTLNGQWLWDRINVVHAVGGAKVGDASDAGMVYYLLSGDQNGTSSSLRSWWGR